VLSIFLFSYKNFTLAEQSAENILYWIQHKIKQKVQFVEWLMGWGKSAAGGVKGGKHFYPGVKSPLSIVAAQVAIQNK